MERSAERVVVLGPGGAGKSVFAQALGKARGLPVIELDKEFWTSDLQAMLLDAWRERQTELAAAPAWVMDGDLGPYDDPAPRLQRADAVVVLDFARWRCVWRALRRGRERRDFWAWLLRWRRVSRPPLLAAIAEHAPAGASVELLANPRAVRRYLDAAGRSATSRRVRRVRRVRRARRARR